MADEQIRKLERAARAGDAADWHAWGRALAASGDPRGEAILAFARRAMRLRTAWERLNAVRNGVRRTAYDGGRRRKVAALATELGNLHAVRLGAVSRAYATAERLGVLPGSAASRPDGDHLSESIAAALHALDGHRKFKADTKLEIELDGLAQGGEWAPGPVPCSYPTRRSRCPQAAVHTMAFRSPEDGSLMALATCRQHQKILDGNLANMKIRAKERPPRLLRDDVTAAAVALVVGARGK